MRNSFIFMLFFITCNTYAINYHAKEIAGDFATIWGMTFINKDQIILNEKGGTVYLLDIKAGTRKPIFKVPSVYTGSQAGLLDVALIDNNSSKNPELLFSYTKATAEGNTLALAKATFINERLDNWKDIFIADAISKTNRHFGSRITQVGDKIFLTIGDRGVRDNGQNKHNHAAAILRLNLDGSSPSDNPFSSSNAKPEIWSYGHRNPQGLFYDQKTQKLWSVEHGERGGDEINLIKKGKNYGWPEVAFGKEYWGPFDVAKTTSRFDVEPPALVYIPSIAPSNMVLYTGNKYKKLKDKLLIGALKAKHINVVSIDDDKLTQTATLFEELNERIRDITVSPDQYIYFSTDSGKIYRIEQAS